MTGIPAAPPPDDPGAAVNVAAPPSRRRPTPFFVVAITVVALTFGWLLWGGLDENVVFFLEPHELLAKGTDGVDVPVRLGGLVKPGSVVWNDTTRDLRFDITDTTGVIIRVHSTGVPPQMFRDAMGVVVEGRLGTDTVFASTSLMIKHSNEYRAPEPGQHPGDAYRSLIKGTTP